MKTKYIFSIILLLAIGGVANAKNMHKVFGTSEQIIKCPSGVQLYVIDPIPVMSIDQVQGEDYVYDYHVTQTLTIKKKMATGLIAAALDTAQYLHGLVKKCPFMGKYAVHFKKGHQSITLLISTQPCDKAIIFCPGSVIDKKHIDLADNSSLVNAINQLITQQTTQTKPQK